jgi:hypothetical protein
LRPSAPIPSSWSCACTGLVARCLVLGYKLRKCIVGIAQERKKI